MIAYFEGKCPDGQEEYSKSAGRVIISQGITNDTNGNQKSFTNGDIGGELTHIMTLSELVLHWHQTGVNAWNNYFGGGTLFGYNEVSDGGTGFYGNVNTSSVGEGKPFNIMQPYLVLVACKYIIKSDLKSIETTKIQDLENDKTQLYSLHNQMQNVLSELKSDFESIQTIKKQKLENELSELKKNQIPFQVISIISLLIICIYFLITLIAKFVQLIKNHQNSKIVLELPRSDSLKS